MINHFAKPRPHLFKRDGVWECWSTGISMTAADSVIGIGLSPSSAYGAWSKVFEARAQ